MNSKTGTMYLLLAVSLAGCTSLQTVRQPAQFIAQEQPKFVVITTSAVQEGDDPLVLNAPRVQEGTVSGLLFGEPTQVPLTQIQTMQAKQFNKQRTIYFAVGSAVVLGGLAYLAAEAGGLWNEKACRPDGRFLQESCGGIECGGSAGSGGGNCYIGATKPMTATGSNRSRFVFMRRLSY